MLPVFALLAVTAVEPTVSTAWLQAHLTDPQVRVICTGTRDDYDRAHIPGARFVDHMDTVGGDHRLLPPDAIAKALAKAGAADGTPAGRRRRPGRCGWWTAPRRTAPRSCSWCGSRRPRPCPCCRSNCPTGRARTCRRGWSADRQAGTGRHPRRAVGPEAARIADHESPRRTDDTGVERRTLAGRDIDPLAGPLRRSTDAEVQVAR